jgi:hypothetical protein
MKPQTEIDRLIVGCSMAHRQLGHIGPTLGVDAVYCHAQYHQQQQKKYNNTNTTIQTENKR